MVYHNVFRIIFISKNSDLRRCHCFSFYLHLTIVSIFVLILCPGKTLAPSVSRHEPRIPSLNVGRVSSVLPHSSAAIVIIRDGKDFILIQWFSKKTINLTWELVGRANSPAPPRPANQKLCE